MSDREIHTEPDEMTAFLAGDEASVAGVFDRFGSGIYSYFLARTGDADASARATERTFARAARQDAEPPGETSLKTWLFANARREARQQDLGFVSPDRPPHDDPDLRVMALAAMSGLSVRDRDLTLLSATGNLDTNELAEVAGLDPSQSGDLLAKTQRRIESALGPLLVARFGTAECEDLRRLVGEWDGSFDGGARAEVNRHAPGCEICRRNRAQLVGVGGVLTQLFTVPAPPDLRGLVIADLRVEPEPEPLDESGDDPVVQDAPPAPPVKKTVPPPFEKDSRDLIMVGVFVLVAAVLGFIGLAVVDEYEPLELPDSSVPGDPPEQSSVTSSTITTGTTAAASATPPSTQEVGGPSPSIQVSADTVDFGSDLTVGQFEITNTGGQTGEVSVESSSEAVVLGAGSVQVPAGQSVTFGLSLDREVVEEGDIQERITLSWAEGQVEISVVGSHVDNPIIHNPQALPSSVVVDGGDGCTNTQTTVSARVTDSSPFDAVVRWSPGGGGTEETVMTEIGGDVYEAVIGPFTNPGTAEARVVATDEVGNAGGASVSIQVAACP